ncbi:helix-turn-helix domain-containing protein [Nocardioides panacisoli]|uniref:Helix-turn-helix domain-containing protein n=1 Tax=Nocardioides panacisoli TaxID=627624 RepID=A0ABP7J2P0_9ACTN
MDITSITPTPAMLKALTHPVRVRLLGLLRAEGPATATTLATRLGLNTGATSYHLRQLAQHGFVEDDHERGNGRDRWWRAAHQATRTETPPPGDREAEETFDAYAQAVAVVMTEQLQRAVEERPVLPEEWRRASTLSDWGLRLTAKRARALLEAMVTVIEETEEDDADGEGVEDFVVQLTAFPRPGRLGAGQ